MIPIRNLFFLMLTCYTLCGFSQAKPPRPISTELDGKVAPYLVMEQKMGSTNFPGKISLRKTTGKVQSLAFKRKENGIPDLLVTYTFTEKDSVLKGIDYEWNPIYADSARKDMPKQIQKRMVKKYQELMLMFFSKLGKRDEIGDLRDLSHLDDLWGISQRNKWVYNDTTDIYLVSRFVNWHILPEGDTVRPTNMIRLSLKRIPKLPPLTLAEMEIPRKRFADFMTSLRSNDLEAARLFFGGGLTKGVDQKSFDRLRAFFKPGALTASSGRIEAIDGEINLVINYIYEDDIKDIKEMFRVIYDNDYKILEIIPMLSRFPQQKKV